jgi:enterochelin esterase family protein
VRATQAPRPAPDDAFVSDFTTDIMPLVQKNYRVSTDRANTAIAGLSMGGNQTLNIAIPNLEKFGVHRRLQLGTAGAFPAAVAAVRLRAGGRRGRAAARDQCAPPNGKRATPPSSDDANLKKGLKVFWFATGKDDFLIGRHRPRSICSRSTASRRSSRRARADTPG